MMVRCNKEPCINMDMYDLIICACCQHMVLLQELREEIDPTIKQQKYKCKKAGTGNPYTQLNFLCERIHASSA